MDGIIVNVDYINQLKSLALEQNEEALVEGLVKNMKSEYAQFLASESELLTVGQVANEEVLRKVHKLKNSFANVGAVMASDLLDDLYQGVSDHSSQADVKNIWNRFKEVANLTFKEIGKVVN